MHRVKVVFPELIIENLRGWDIFWHVQLTQGCWGAAKSIKNSPSTSWLFDQVPKKHLPKIFFHNMWSMNLAELNKLKIIAPSYDILLQTESWLNKHKASQGSKNPPCIVSIVSVEAWPSMWKMVPTVEPGKTLQINKFLFTGYSISLTSATRNCECELLSSESQRVREREQTMMSRRRCIVMIWKW